MSLTQDDTFAERQHALAGDVIERLRQPSTDGVALTGPETARLLQWIDNAIKMRETWANLALSYEAAEKRHVDRILHLRTGIESLLDV